MKICLKCKAEHSNIGRFCSRSCSNSRSWSDADRERKSLAARKSVKVQRANHLKYQGLVSVTCVICSQTFDVRMARKNIKTCSLECQKKHQSQRSKDSPNCGGYRPGSGRSKHGWYNGIQFDSTYELAFYIDQNNASLKRNTRRFKFRDTYYVPDFECDNVFYEIKGYHTPIVDEKIKAMRDQGYEVILINADQMKPIIERIKKQFSVKDLSLLYEQSKDSSKTSDSDR